MTYTRIVDLLEWHRAIEEAVDGACHETSTGDDAWLSHLERLLQAHIRDEETLLIPAWAQACPDPPRVGKPDLLLDEHRKIERRLADIRAAGGFERLCALRGLHHLLEHHDEREAQTIKPGLDELLPSEQVTAILARIGPIPDPPPDRPPLDRTPIDAFAAELLSMEVTDRFAAKARRLKTRASDHLAAGHPLVALDALLSFRNLLAARGQ